MGVSKENIQNNGLYKELSDTNILFYYIKMRIFAR